MLFGAKKHAFTLVEPAVKLLSAKYLEVTELRRSSQTKRPIAQEIPVLCKLWFEDGVWNGSAHDLPVAVFGKTIDEARKNLSEALVSHFRALQEIGKAEQVTRNLCRLTEARLSFDEMPSNELFWKAIISTGETCEVVA